MLFTLIVAVAGAVIAAGTGTDTTPSHWDWAGGGVVVGLVVGIVMTLMMLPADSWGPHDDDEDPDDPDVVTAPAEPPAPRPDPLQPLLDYQAAYQRVVDGDIPPSTAAPDTPGRIVLKTGDVGVILEGPAEYDAPQHEQARLNAMAESEGIALPAVIMRPTEVGARIEASRARSRDRGDAIWQMAYAEARRHLSPARIEQGEAEQGPDFIRAYCSQAAEEAYRLLTADPGTTSVANPTCRVPNHLDNKTLFRDHPNLFQDAPPAPQDASAAVSPDPAQFGGPGA